MSESSIKDLIQKALTHLAKRFGLRENDFEFMPNGIQNVDHMGDGAKLVYFNIVNKAHELYKSTVTYKYQWE